MSTPARRGAVVADRVLGATLELLTERGYSFSVDEVAGRAGVHKTTVYRRWPTKPVLVAAAMTRVAEQQVDAPASDDAEADLLDLALRVAAALRLPSGVNALRAALSTVGEDPELQEVTARFLAARYATATPLIRAAQAAGVVRGDLDPVLVWQAVVNPLHLNAVTGGPLDDGTVRALVDLVLSGARPRQR